MLLNICANLVISQIEQLEGWNIFNVDIDKFFDPIVAKMKFFQVRTISKSGHEFDLVVVQVKLFESVEFNEKLVKHVISTC